MEYKADGYGKQTNFSTKERFYFSITRSPKGGGRVSKAKFKRARDAEAYGIRLVSRYAEMKKHENDS